MKKSKSCLGTDPQKTGPLKVKRSDFLNILKKLSLITNSTTCSKISQLVQSEPEPDVHQDEKTTICNETLPLNHGHSSAITSSDGIKSKNQKNESKLESKIRKKPKTRNKKWGHQRKMNKINIKIQKVLPVEVMPLSGTISNFQADKDLAMEINSTILNNIKAKELNEAEAVMELLTSKSNHRLMKDIRVILQRVDEDPRYTELIQKLLQNRIRLHEALEAKTDINIDEFELGEENFYEEKDETASRVSDDGSESPESLLQSSPEPQKPIKCKYCSRFFANKKLLKLHEGLHSNRNTIPIVAKINKKLVPSKRVQLKSRIIFGNTLLMKKLKQKIPRTSKGTKESNNSDSDGSVSSPINNGATEFETLEVSGDWSEPEEMEMDDYFVKDPLALETEVESNVDLDHMVIKLDPTDIENWNLEEEDPFDISDKVQKDPIMTLNSSSGGILDIDNNGTSANLCLTMNLQFELTSNEVPSVVMRNGEMCQASNISHLLDLLDGPAPESATGHSETLTLNYVDGAKQLDSYACVHCPKIFDSKSLLEDHAQNSHFARINKPYICLQPNCSMRFASSQSLQVHRTLAHSHRANEGAIAEDNTNVVTDRTTFHVPVVKGPVTGRMQDIIFDSTQTNQSKEMMVTVGTAKTVSAIAEANEDSLSGLKHKCKTCGKKFKYLIDYVNHEWGHLDDKSGTQCCRFCPRRFDDLDKYYTHIKCHVKLIAVRRNQNVGKSKTLSGNNMRALSSFHNIPRLPPLFCQHCGHKSTDLQTYVEHIKETHGLQHGIVNYSCPFPRCEKRMFRFLWNFRVHLGTHQKRLECLPCGLQFKGKMEFFQHKRLKHKTERIMRNVSELVSVNTNVELPIWTAPIPIAKKKLSQICTACLEEVDVTTTHHNCPKGDPSIFPCSLCRFSFRRIKDVWTHLTEVHPKIPCRICMKGVFRTKIDIHLKSHLGETVHDCNHCHLPYLTHDSLKKHLATKLHKATIIKNIMQTKIIDGNDRKTRGKFKEQESIKSLVRYPSHEKKSKNSRTNGNPSVQTTGHRNYMEVEKNFREVKLETNYILDLPRNQTQDKCSHFPCNECTKCFMNFSKLQSHAAKFHGFYVCAVCLKFIQNQFEFGVHRRSHEEKFENFCAFCSILFTTRQDLVDHELCQEHVFKMETHMKKCNAVVSIVSANMEVKTESALTDPLCLAKEDEEKSSTSTLNPLFNFNYSEFLCHEESGEDENPTFDPLASDHFSLNSKNEESVTQLGLNETPNFLTILETLEHSIVDSPLTCVMLSKFEPETKPWSQ